MSDFSAYAGTWIIDPTHSRIGFVARHAMVAKARGQFDDFDGSLVIEAADPTASKAAFSARLASINTGNPGRDAHLHSADFFDVEKNESMTFQTTGLKQTGDDTFDLTGLLSIGQAERPVVVEVELTGIATDPFGNTRAGFEGKTELSRKDFGLNWNVALEAGGVLVGDKIKVELDISAIMQA